MTYTRSRHPFTKREVVYCKTPATESPISAKVRFCNAHTASSLHVRSRRPGQKYQCRTKSETALEVAGHLILRSLKSISEAQTYTASLLQHYQVPWMRVWRRERSWKGGYSGMEMPRTGGQLSICAGKGLRALVPACRRRVSEKP